MTRPSKRPEEIEILHRPATFQQLGRRFLLRVLVHYTADLRSTRQRMLVAPALPAGFPREHNPCGQRQRFLRVRDSWSPASARCRTDVGSTRLAAEIRSLPVPNALISHARTSSSKVAFATEVVRVDPFTAPKALFAAEARYRGGDAGKRAGGPFGWTATRHESAKEDAAAGYAMCQTLGSGNTTTLNGTCSFSTGAR